MAGDDELDVDPATLRPGDTFVQSFAITVPAGIAPGSYLLRVGVYDPATGARLPQLSGEDGLVLQVLNLPQ